MWRNLWKKFNPMDLGFREEEEELGFVILEFSEDEEEYENGDLDHSLSLWQIVHLSDPKSEEVLEKKEPTMEKVKDYNSDEPEYNPRSNKALTLLIKDYNSDDDDDDDYFQEDAFGISQSEYENLTKPRVNKSLKRRLQKVPKSRHKKPSKSAIFDSRSQPTMAFWSSAFGGDFER